MKLNKVLILSLLMVLLLAVGGCQNPKQKKQAKEREDKATEIAEKEAETQKEREELDKQFKPADDVAVQYLTASYEENEELLFELSHEDSSNYDFYKDKKRKHGKPNAFDEIKYYSLERISSQYDETKVVHYIGFISTNSHKGEEVETGGFSTPKMFSLIEDINGEWKTDSTGIGLYNNSPSETEQRMSNPNYSKIEFYADL